MRHHQKLTIDEIIAQTGLKKRTVQRVFEVLYRTGDVVPMAKCRGRPGKLSNNHLAVISCDVFYHN